MKVDQGRVQFFAGGGKWICDNSVFTLVGWAGGLHEVQTYKNHPEDFLEHNLLETLIISGFDGVEAPVVVAGWGATTRRGGRYFSSSFLYFTISSFLSWSSLFYCSSSSFCFSSTCFFLTENLRQGSFTQMTLMPTIDLLSRLSWCRPANILQWLEVPPVDGDRWEVIFNLQGSR